MKDKLRSAIAKHIAADTNRKAGAAKGAITRLCNERAEEIGVTAARAEIYEVLNEFDQLPSWLIFRFACTNHYIEGSRVMGWWCDFTKQLQAEELPLSITSDRTCVNFFGFEKERSLWESRGFLESKPLVLQPYSSITRPSLIVQFPTEESLVMRQVGYALPCPLQWRWDDEGLIVTRSIIPHGFWQAWKWWAGCQWWYLEKRPELFGDLDWWGDETHPKRWEPTDNPGAMVLGGFTPE